MLFAIWTGNRATEEAEQASVTSTSLHTVSRQNTLPMSGPAVRLDVTDHGEHATDLKVAKLEADEALGHATNDDIRPAVFKSTFWEVCAVASLVCGQLTNVFTLNDCVDGRNLLMLNKLPPLL